MTCRALASKWVPAGRGPSGGAASRCPPRSRRSTAAIAGRPKAASRRKSRRVEGAGVVGRLVSWRAPMDGRGRASVDVEEFVRVEQHEAEIGEPLLRDEGPARPAPRDPPAGGRTPAARRRSTCLAASSPASRRRRAANRSAHFSMNELFVIESACKGVIVRVRRGAMTDGSGQSSASSIGWFPIAPERRYTVPAVDGVRELARGVGELVVLGAELHRDVAEARPADLPVQRPGDGQRGVADRLAFQRRRLVLQSRRFSASSPSARSSRDRVS